MKQTNTLSDQNKEEFYSLLVSQREAFDRFYGDQIPYFRTVAEIFIDGMDSDDVLKLYQDIPAGQFTKSSTEYMTYVENAVKVFLQSQAKKRLKDLWVEKTGTKDPRDWSARFDTPILCMIARNLLTDIYNAIPAMIVELFWWREAHLHSRR